MRRSTWATLAILAVTAIWGSTFFIIKDAVEVIDPLDYLTVRFAIAACLTGAVFLPRLRRLSARQWVTGLAIGGLYGLAQIAQTIGLKHTSASISGFITGTYVILTPVLMWLLLRARVGARTWATVALAAVGLAVLTISGPAEGGYGAALTLLGAVLYALHIIVLDSKGAGTDSIALTVAQLIGVTLVCAVAGAPGGYDVPVQGGPWGAILYTAVISGVLTLLLQTWAQKHISPTRTSLLFTFEPVFASLFAVLLGGEHLTLRVVLGGAVIIGATLLGVAPSPADQSSAQAGPSPDNADATAATSTTHHR